VDSYRNVIHCGEKRALRQQWGDRSRTSSSNNYYFSDYAPEADKSGQPELLLVSDTPVYPASWTPDGKTLVHIRQEDAKTHICSRAGRIR
jgi:hypothetical protein